LFFFFFFTAGGRGGPFWGSNKRRGTPTAHGGARLWRTLAGREAPGVALRLGCSLVGGGGGLGGGAEIRCAFREGDSSTGYLSRGEGGGGQGTGGEPQRPTGARAGISGTTPATPKLGLARQGGAPVEISGHCPPWGAPGRFRGPQKMERGGGGGGVGPAPPGPGGGAFRGAGRQRGVLYVACTGGATTPPNIHLETNPRGLSLFFARDWGAFSGPDLGVRPIAGLDFYGYTKTGHGSRGRQKS